MGGVQCTGSESFGLPRSGAESHSRDSPRRPCDIIHFCRGWRRLFVNSLGIPHWSIAALCNSTSIGLSNGLRPTRTGKGEFCRFIKRTDERRSIHYQEQDYLIFCPPSARAFAGKFSPV